GSSTSDGGRGRGGGSTQPVPAIHLIPRRGFCGFWNNTPIIRSRHSCRSEPRQRTLGKPVKIPSAGAGARGGIKPDFSHHLIFGTGTCSRAANSFRLISSSGAGQASGGGNSIKRWCMSIRRQGNAQLEYTPNRGAG